MRFSVDWDFVETQRIYRRKKEALLGFHTEARIDRYDAQVQLLN